ncbi:MAG: hypothetical protein JWO94_412 [Verrucomicrobiaceae bacterium]|nr:hypothetical protein [Verrucomicrobiaceae bacterium]
MLKAAGPSVANRIARTAYFKVLRSQAISWLW